MWLRSPVAGHLSRELASMHASRLCLVRWIGTDCLVLGRCRLRLGRVQ